MVTGTGYWLLATGYRAMVASTGYWLLDTSYWVAGMLVLVMATGTGY